ncbi:MAG: diguanylate cyclase [Phycisphaerae bacterium]|nr:diguanylate cyclase [Phycisphaerae bacterium]
MSDTSKRPRVLIIEEDLDRRALLCQTLQSYYRDADGDCVTGVASACEALTRDLSQFDIVVQNYHLPDMDGMELLSNILARANVPVMVVSSENVSRVAAEALRRGAQDYVVEVGDYLFSLPLLIEKNIRQFEVRQENLRLQERMTAMLEELQEKNAQLLNMTQTDPLTNLANRRRFNELLERIFSEARRYNFDLACCMCDLDNFKQFNDVLGHQRGDELLQTTSDLIASGLRSSDVAARYGGDEFVLLLPHTSLERAVAVCQRIRGRLARASRKFSLLPQGLHVSPKVTVSIGIASLQADGPKTAGELVAMADQALYLAKGRGKNRITTRTPLGDDQQSA